MTRPGAHIGGGARLLRRPGRMPRGGGVTRPRGCSSWSGATGSSGAARLRDQWLGRALLAANPSPAQNIWRAVFAVLFLLAIPAAPSHAQTAVNALLPRDLSPWAMFMGAGIVVKAVMIGLAIASVATWTVWLAKTVELFQAQRAARRDLDLLAAAPGLEEAAAYPLSGNGSARALLDAADEEWRQSASALDDREGLKERVASRLERIEAAAGRRMTMGTGILATIGATAPFVGLFGTVWGIMNSFIGISRSQTTNLAVVAPGIAEALLATACGLIAAIPAVTIYNRFARQIAGCRAQTADTAAAVLRLVSRDLSLGHARPPIGED